MRSKDSLKRDRKEAFRDARLVIVATEGDTEQVYLKALSAEYLNPRVHVLLLARENDESRNSNPAFVLEQLESFKSTYALDQEDELWLVIDRDRWTKKMLGLVARSCKQDKSLQMALSNPCFELWLILHLEDVVSLPFDEQKRYLENKREKRRTDPYLKCRIRTLLGHYSETNYDTNKLMPHVDMAVAQARLMDINHEDRWPQSLGTRVYLLAESIMNKK